MMRYAARQDSNHGEIMDVFRSLLGEHVSETFRFGDGVGDGYVSFGCYGVWVEIKSDPNAKLTPAELRFHMRHAGCIFRVENTQQAENVARIVRARGMALADESR
jgi:hypothetical protein